MKARMHFGSHDRNGSRNFFYCQDEIMIDNCRREEGLRELRKLYGPVRGQIEARLEEFRRLWEEGSEEAIFLELVFCLLTPQSRARTCWAAAEGLASKGLVLEGEACRIQEELRGVRFGHRKSEYICEARRTFSPGEKLSVKAMVGELGDPFEAREWLVRNVKGLGYKEASHFLRNTGQGEDLAILDRHVLRNLRLLGVIDDLPASLSKKVYLEIERRMRAFSVWAEIPMGHLDLLLWYREAGEVFK
jgi:N-glycosylase/DNA lyase